MSEPYIVSALKYRPSSFESVVGQRNLTETLKNSIATGRLAHAYLFCGPRGVGKTSCARIFARTINCLSPTPSGEACGQCESCKAIDRNNSFNIVELDAASNNSVDDIRKITEQVAVPPQVGKYRVFIIDEVHMLSPAAFNAFLKTLEEPPSYAVFILATTEKHKVLPTILSRCQIYDFKRITVNDTIDHLENVARKEGITADRRALGVIAAKADGAMRDALSIFDQVASASGRNITYEAAVNNLNVLDYDYFFRFVDMFAKGDVAGVLLLFKDVRDRGFDPLFFVGSLASHIRDLMVAADPRTLPLLEAQSEVAARLTAQATALPLKWYYSAIKILNDTDLNYRTSSNKQLLVELALIRLAQLKDPASPFELSDRPVALRNPSDPPRATTVAPSPQPAANETPSPQQAVKSETHSAPANPGAKPRRRTVSISGKPEVAPVSIQTRRREFTDAEFMAAWNEFAQSIPDRQILQTGMKANTPAADGSSAFTVMVNHPAQLSAFETAMPELLAFLRDKLGNDTVTLHLKLDNSKKETPYLSPSEFLRHTAAENPRLAEFLKSLDIEVVQ